MSDEKTAGLPTSDEASAFKMTIVYDNSVHDERCKSEWGFACVVEVGGKRILFDTGGDSTILLDNLQRLGIDPASIAVVVLSHDHWDHVGGLRAFLARDSSAAVYLLPSFSSQVKSIVQEAGAQLVVTATPSSLAEGIATTGRLGDAIEEQSLVVRTNKGLVLITGCAHPGIVEIIEHVRKTVGEDIYMVIGGFHLGEASKGELEGIVAKFREYGIKKAGPCHCSGQLCRKLFRENCQCDYVNVGVGLVLRE